MKVLWRFLLIFATLFPAAVVAQPQSPGIYVPSGITSLDATTVSASVAFPSTGSTLNLLVINAGPSTVFVATGNSSVVASLASIPILAGGAVVLPQSYNTTIAAITASGTAALSIQSGTGIPFIVSGGLGSQPTSGCTTNCTFTGTTVIAGSLGLPASAVGGATLNLPEGTAPSAPNNGDIWTTTAGLYVRIGGTTIGPIGTGGGCTTNCTFTGTTTTAGISDSGGINTTAATGYRIGGQNAISWSSQSTQQSMAIGPGAGASLPSNGTFSTFIGSGSGAAFSGAGGEDTCVGVICMQYLVSGVFDTALGEHAMGYEVSANSSTAIGNDDQRNYVSGGGNTSVGKSAMSVGGGINNTALGTQALAGNSTTVIVGGTATAGDTISLTFTGGFTGSPATTTPITITGGETTTQMATALLTAIQANSVLNTVMGTGSQSSANQLSLFWEGTCTTGQSIVTTSSITGSATETIGSTCGPTGANNIAIGEQAIFGVYGLSTAAYNIGIGQNTLNNLVSGNFNVAVGQSPLFNLTTASGAVGIGLNAGATTTTNPGTYIGSGAGQYPTGGGNVAFGLDALQGASAGSTAQNDVAFGNLALQAATTAQQDVAVGGSAALLCTTCQHQTIIGFGAGGAITTADKSTLIGYNAGATYVSGFGVVLVCSGNFTCTTPAANTHDYISIDGAIVENTQAPTIGSGFGSGASVPVGASTFLFEVNVGTGGTASSGVITMPTPAAPNAWGCQVVDVTNPATSNTVITPSGAGTTVTLTNYSRTTGALAAWAASDVLLVGPCGAL
jgi:hypothetical protein